MNRNLIFLCFLLLFATMSCQKVEIEDYKTAIVGDWISPEVLFTIPSPGHSMHLFSEDGAYTHKFGDCDEDTARGDNTYRIKGDSIIIFFQTSIENWRDTFLITHLTKNKLELRRPAQVKPFKYNRCK